MPEDTIDGSNLELIEQSNTQAETATEQVQTETVQPETTQTTQPPQTNIPEQFKDYTPEQWFNEWNKTNSMLGRYKAEVSNLRTRQPQVPVYNQQIPSPLPGQEASGQVRQSENLDEIYFEKPSKVIEQIVRKEVTAGIQSYEHLQQQRQQQAQMGRAQWISSIDDDELQNLRLEENYTPEHEALMESLAKRDSDTINKLRDPNLTEQSIRDTVRGLYAKADRILKGQLQDPEKIKALNIAQKQAAANGAPATRASSTSGPSSSPLEEWGQIDPRLAEDYAFMVELSRKSSS